MEKGNDVKFIQLRDDRTLAYSEYGDNRGYPVFYFHGSPGSRLEGIHTHTPGCDNGFRIIAPDRPGMGRSDYQKNRSWLDWPKDVLELSEHLKIKRFGVMGASGGSPPVLSCAYSIPHYLQFAIDIGGWTPNIEGNLYQHLAPIERTFGRTVRFPVIFRFFYFIMGLFVKHQDGQKLMNNFKGSMCETDKKIIEKDHEITIFLANDIKESFRQGSKGPALDALLQYRDWGFNLEDISIPVHIYHGAEDKFVPVQFAKALHQKIPQSIIKTYPRLGHFSIVTMFDEVFREINEFLQR